MEGGNVVFTTARPAQSARMSAAVQRDYVTREGKAPRERQVLSGHRWYWTEEDRTQIAGPMEPPSERESHHQKQRWVHSRLKYLFSVGGESHRHSNEEKEDGEHLEPGKISSPLRHLREKGMGDRQGGRAVQETAWSPSTLRRDTTNVACHADDPPE